MGNKQEQASPLFDSNSMQASVAKTTGTEALELGFKGGCHGQSACPVLQQLQRFAGCRL